MLSNQSRKHGKRLTKGVSNTRTKSISMGIQKLMDAKTIDKTSAAVLVAFGAELLTKQADDREVSADEFKVTRREAERAARTLADKGSGAKKALTNMGTFAALGPATRTLAKGVSAAALAKKGRGRAAIDAMKGALKDKGALIEQVSGGAMTGAAVTALSEGREARGARKTISKYLETKPRTKSVDKLKAVL